MISSAYSSHFLSLPGHVRVFFVGEDEEGQRTCRSQTARKIDHVGNSTIVIIQDLILLFAAEDRLSFDPAQLGLFHTTVDVRTFSHISLGPGDDDLLATLARAATVNCTRLAKGGGHLVPVGDLVITITGILS